jgi:Fic family protein
MSALLDANYHFINLLLNTDRSQQFALLDTLTKSQIDLLSEIFFNLWSVVELDESQQKFMKRRGDNLRSLSQVNRSRRSRHNTIKLLRKRVLDILLEVKDNILNADPVQNTSAASNKTAADISD